MTESNQPGDHGRPFDWGDAMTTPGVQHPPSPDPTTVVDRWNVPGPPPQGEPGSQGKHGGGGGKALTTAIVVLSVLVVTMTVAVIVVALTRDSSEKVAATGDDDRPRTTTTQVTTTTEQSPRPADLDDAPTPTGAVPIEQPSATAAPLPELEDMTRSNPEPDPGRVPVPNPGTPALQRIHDQIASDRSLAPQLVDNRWVAQLSSKKPGITWRGKTWEAEDIWQEFVALDDEYGALLVDSAEWGFQRGDLWVTVTRRTFATGEEANDWCRAMAYGPDDCYAKLMHRGEQFKGDTLHWK